MVNELNWIFRKVNDKFGVSIKLPEPKKNTLKAASTVNFVVGAGLVVASVIFTNKWCAVIGGLGIIGGIIQRHEGKAAK